MCFQDLEAGSQFPIANSGRKQRRLSCWDPSQDVAVELYKISTTLNVFFRLVNSI
ncbi:unnamed protein product [Brassica rapa]|uniref:Uncharacterized protein n=2 Tax=Brassica TaxID=3705 RepID=A0A8D9D7P1_BRACM|nr:unnamed protein product [Brassica napus]CAG7869274.1 unnamed protein product [Brassica rapa]